jgi:DNA-binding transcriptional MerR regulator
VDDNRMQMSELSRRSGVPIPTIKYYLREGLMMPGTATAATRAEYGQPHLRRLRLIRALLEVGGLPVASIRRIIAALDDETVGLHVLFGTVQYALPPHISPRPGDPDWRAAEREVDALITGLGWQVEPDSPARGLLAGALVALGRLDQAPAGLSLRVYAEAMRRLAGLEIDSVRLPAEVGAAAEDGSAEDGAAGEAGEAGAAGEADEAGEAGAAEARPAGLGLAERTDALESVVAGMVLYERVIIALRRLAQEDASARRFRPAAVD